MKTNRIALWVALVLVGSTGCRTDFAEVHFYRVDAETGDRPNYYRLTISGDASFSQAKYISGCYDERAVQIVFDEIGTDPNGGVVRFLSGGEVEIAGSKVTTVSAESEVCPPGKSKLMIFSTNAKVIADTIGAFAESQVVAQSVVGLLQHDELEDLGRRQGELQVESTAQVSENREIAALVGSLPAGDDPGQAETRKAALRILNAIARAQGRFEPFTTVEEARLWFQMRQTAEVSP